MTPRQAEKAARSLFFRRRMTENLSDLEAALILYLLQWEEEEAILGDFRLRLVEGRVEVEVFDCVDLRQKTFPGMCEEEAADCF